uniref:Uncharacterized protein n=2 Tax=Aromatoleum anaerobium TaxID=182180 RepID=A0ABX1PMP7_9RHOO
MERDEMDDFQSTVNAAIEATAADIDLACKRRLRDTKWNLALEREPCLKGAVSLRRIVHALALRAVESAQEGRPEIRLHPNERWRWKYHRYLVAVVRLNAALAEAARRGAFKARDSLTRLPADNIELPNIEAIVQWERAALPDTRTPESKRRAAELMMTFNGWLLCGEHFSASLAVDLAEFSAWAEAEGIVTHGEIAERLSAIEDEFMAMQAIAQDSGIPSDDQKQSDPQDDADAQLAALFDPVAKEQLEAMFPDKGWANYADKAASNGLANAARESRAMFNPYRAACWWLSRKAPVGWKWERCARVLANNLPARSLDSRHLLTGDFD